MRSLCYILLLTVTLLACTEQKEHIAPAIRERDSVATMVSYGINTLISDSGVMRYRIIAERWEVNEALNPPRWIFRRGMFMEQFDEKFHVEAYLQADTAIYYNVARLWHLTGNVRVKTLDGMRYNSEELYWDQDAQEMYSYCYTRIQTPERELEGNYFKSDEQFHHYIVTQTKGAFIQEKTKEDNKSKTNATDTTKKPTASPEEMDPMMMHRQQAVPIRKR